MATQFTCGGDATAVLALPHPPAAPKSSAEFKASLDRWFPEGHPKTYGNAVVAYAYGICAFRDMADALATATQPHHRIYLLGWGTDGDTEMPPAQAMRTLSDLLTNTKAQVRAMFWKHPDGPNVLPQGGGNFAIAKHLNALPNAAAILDDKLPEIWALRLLGRRFGGIHHQKLLVVRGSLGLIAFVGGMDLVPNRIEMNNAGEPLHDVHVRIVGEAGVVLLHNFRDRWLDHPASADLDKSKFNLDRARVRADFAAARPVEGAAARALPTWTRATSSESCAVAVGRTFAELAQHTPSKLDYDFAPYGETTAWNLVAAGVKATREYLYIEDQYFVSRRLSRLLADKLRDAQFKFLLILMVGSPSIENNPELIKRAPDGTITVPNEVPFGIAARNDIRRALTAVDPQRTKWRMFRLKDCPDPGMRPFAGSYVHSKLFICDDEYVITGSANANDRGYTYDTELMVGITNDLYGRTIGQRFARDLRVNLWHKHLGVPHHQLDEWPKSLPLWFAPPRSAMVVDTSDLENSPMLGPNAMLKADSPEDVTWRQAIDPDADNYPP